jgi:hypothetical protein
MAVDGRIGLLAAAAATATAAPARRLVVIVIVVVGLGLVLDRERLRFGRGCGRSCGCYELRWLEQQATGYRCGRSRLRGSSGFGRLDCRVRRLTGVRLDSGVGSGPGRLGPR